MKARAEIKFSADTLITLDGTSTVKAVSFIDANRINRKSKYSNGVVDWYAQTMIVAESSIISRRRHS